jgi:hypothetical protein
VGTTCCCGEHSRNNLLRCGQAAVGNSTALVPSHQRLGLKKIHNDWVSTVAWFVKLEKRLIKYRQCSIHCYSDSSMFPVFAPCIFHIYKTEAASTCVCARFYSTMTRRPLSKHGTAGCERLTPWGWPLMMLLQGVETWAGRRAETNTLGCLEPYQRYHWGPRRTMEHELESLLRDSHDVRTDRT